MSKPTAVELGGHCGAEVITCTAGYLIITDSILPPTALRSGSGSSLLPVKMQDTRYKIALFARVFIRDTLV